jgi:hypothetical protein
MLTIAWNPSGFHVIDVLSKGQKFNTGCYISAIFEPLVAWRKAQASSPKKLIVHGDNANPHTAKVTRKFFEQNFLKRNPHPHIRQILHHLTSFFLTISKDFSQDNHSQAKMSSSR